MKNKVRKFFNRENDVLDPTIRVVSNFGTVADNDSQNILFFGDLPQVAFSKVME